MTGLCENFAVTAFVCTWDGSRERYDPRNYHRHVQETRKRWRPRYWWSTGNRRQGMAKGDRVFLLRQHSERGIVASGHVVAGDIVDGRVEIAWDHVVSIDQRLPIEMLLARIPSTNWNAFRSSGPGAGRRV